LKQDKPEKFDFEAALKRLEEIVGLLEAGEEPLEKGIELFEEAMALSARCQERLQQIEGRIEQLVQGSGGELKREPLPHDENEA
jgi:exodeoxyribonuclease VII small subunit